MKNNRNIFCITISLFIPSICMLILFSISSPIKAQESIPLLQKQMVWEHLYQTPGSPLKSRLFITRLVETPSGVAITFNFMKEIAGASLPCQEKIYIDFAYASHLNNDNRENERSFEVFEMNLEQKDYTSCELTFTGDVVKSEQPYKAEWFPVQKRLSYRLQENVSELITKIMINDL
ncbi:MAG: hypothetical protein HQK50_14815 [Oligoflexia bacterium]|nr:hypothetical protein [Oligoflexia bacterium]MBF0366843.1 hypothetical protein [Oligoflexia bacterium]